MKSHQCWPDIGSEMQVYRAFLSVFQVLIYVFIYSNLTANESINLNLFPFLIQALFCPFVQRMCEFHSLVVFNLQSMLGMTSVNNFFCFSTLFHLLLGKLLVHSRGLINFGFLSEFLNSAYIVVPGVLCQGKILVSPQLFYFFYVRGTQDFWCISMMEKNKAKAIMETQPL